MQNLLILTDFSEAASYAATYACMLARQLNICDIVLYHSTEAVITPGNGIVYSGNEESLRSLAKDKLAEMAASLQDQAPPGCTIRYRTDDIVLEDINDIIVEEGIELVVMGTSGKGKLESMISGSHAVRVFEASNVPVVLVPLQAPVIPVSSIVFACDFKNVKDTLPVGTIRKILGDFHVPLSVIHVGNGDENTGQQQHALDEALSPFQARYSELNSDDTAKGIISFAGQNEGALVMLVAKDRNFLAKFFHSSVTRELAFESPVPLLILREVSQVNEIPLLEI